MLTHTHTMLCDTSLGLIYRDPHRAVKEPDHFFENDGLPQTGHAAATDRGNQKGHQAGHGPSRSGGRSLPERPTPRALDSRPPPGHSPGWRRKRRPIAQGGGGPGVRRPGCWADLLAPETGPPDGPKTSPKKVNPDSWASPFAPPCWGPPGGPGNGATRRARRKDGKWDHHDGDSRSDRRLA